MNLDWYQSPSKDLFGLRKFRWEQWRSVGHWEAPSSITSLWPSCNLLSVSIIFFKRLESKRLCRSHRQWLEYSLPVCWFGCLSMTMFVDLSFLTFLCRVTTCASMFVGVTSTAMGSRTEVAMSLSPLLRTNLSLENRCELALTSFLSWELFEMLSVERAQEMGLPKGSCFLASQSLSNLIGCAMSAVVMTLTLDATFDPWQYGSMRLSELGVEEFFSQLRAQSSNSQLNTRAYFLASARTSLKNSKKLNAAKPARPGQVQALSEDVCLACVYFP